MNTPEQRLFVFSDLNQGWTRLRDVDTDQSIDQRGYLSIGFSSNYVAMVNAAGRDRSDMGVGWGNVNGSINQLARVSNPSGISGRRPCP